MKDLATSASKKTENQPIDQIDFKVRLNEAIIKSRKNLLSQQTDEGYWVDELESNVTITAELIFFMHFTDTIDLVKQEKLTNYLLHKQRPDGSWPLYFGGSCDINSTVEAYLALKVAGIPANRPEMQRTFEYYNKNGRTYLI